MTYFLESQEKCCFQKWREKNVFQGISQPLLHTKIKLLFLNICRFYAFDDSLTNVLASKYFFKSVIKIWQFCLEGTFYTFFLLAIQFYFLRLGYNLWHFYLTFSTHTTHNLMNLASIFFNLKEFTFFLFQKVYQFGRLEMLMYNCFPLWRDVSNNPKVS